MWARRTSATLAVVYGTLIAAIILIAAYYNNRVGTNLFEWSDAVLGASAIALIVSGFAFRREGWLLIAAWALAVVLAFWQAAIIQKPSLLHGSPEVVAMFRQGNETWWHYVLGVVVVKLVVSLVGFCLAIYAGMRRPHVIAT